MNSADKLSIMLDMQKKFQERLGFDYEGLGMKERTAAFKEMMLHTEQELHECVRELPHFKHWKDYSNLSHDDMERMVDLAKDELIDAWHFFMNLMLILGLTADEFYDLYCAKLSVNHKRQTDGYVQAAPE